MDAYADLALADDELYNAVIAHRKKFYHIGTVDYSKDEKSHITIWPNEMLEKAYERDYKLMINSFIYDKMPLSFADLRGRIRDLEAKFRKGAK